MRDRDGRSSQRDRERPPLPRADEPARQADRTRESGSPDRIRDAAEIRQRAELSRQREQVHPGWSHTFREHVDATDQELQRRAATGINARGRPEGFIPEHATRWQSDAACVIAAGRLWRTPAAQQARNEIDAKIRAGQPTKLGFPVRASVSQVLGPDWRDDVYGRSRESHGRQLSRWRTDSQAVAIFRKQADGRWHLYTCYPQVVPTTGP
jgi:hypothetical protein